MDLICPKCQGAMRSYERSGLTVDQCSECRGIFLDRGELERLVDAENGHYAAAASGQSGSAPAYGYSEERPGESREAYSESHRQNRPREYRENPREFQERQRESRPREGDDYSYSYGKDSDYYRKKKKKSFLEELFD